MLSSVIDFYLVVVEEEVMVAAVGAVNIGVDALYQQVVGMEAGFGVSVRESDIHIRKH